MHRWDSIPKGIFPKHPNVNLPAMFSSTSILFSFLAFEIRDRLYRLPYSAGRLDHMEWPLRVSDPNFLLHELVAG